MMKSLSKNLVSRTLFTIFGVVVCFSSCAFAEAWQDILSKPKLSAKDFVDLRFAALPDSSSSRTCASPSASTSTSDLSLMQMGAYVHFADAAYIIPTNLTAQLQVFSESFYRLFKANLVQIPSSEFSEVGFTRPVDASLITDYDFVVAHNTKPIRNNVGSLASVMIKIMHLVSADKIVCGMSPQESAAVNLYTKVMYLELNSYLRKHETSNVKFNELEKLIRSGLDKLANFSGVVYRSTTFYAQSDMPESVYREHRVGQTLTYDGFSSTATVYAGAANFILFSATGKVLATSENEVLFRSHTKFRVLYNSCEEQKLNVWQGCQVILKEI